MKATTSNRLGHAGGRVRVGSEKKSYLGLVPFGCSPPLSPVNDVVKVAVLHRRDDLLEEPLRLLRRGPPLGHDVVKQLPVRRVLLL